MTITREKSQALFGRALKVMPRGVNSNFRYWGDHETPVISHAKGPYFWDPDGNQFIDYRLGFGPIILGHANEEVNEAVREAISDGSVFAFTTEREVRVAEKIVEMCPATDMVRLANSGTEATMHAMRVARAYTGRDKVIKFEGQYHGMHDYVLWSTATAQPDALGNRRSPIPQQASSGIPKVIRDLIISLPFNDHELLEKSVKENWQDVACIIVEPMLGNVGSIEPNNGFLEFVRKLCDEYGIIFVLDEVKTGFRVARGGAQELFDINPDLTTYAKSIANGYPIAAFGGKREVMSIVGDSVAHGGTYTGNTVGVAAAEKTLEIISGTDALEQVAQAGRHLMKGISDVLECYDVPYVFSGHPSMFGLFFAEDKPLDFRDWAASDYGLYEELGEALIANGVFPEPDNREPWFVAMSHNDGDVLSDTLNGFEAAAKAVFS